MGEEINATNSIRIVQLYRHSPGQEIFKCVGVVAVVVFVAGFDNVSRRVLFAVVMVLAENCPLDQRPETFYCVSVNQSLSVGLPRD